MRFVKTFIDEWERSIENSLWRFVLNRVSLSFGGGDSSTDQKVVRHDYAVIRRVDLLPCFTLFCPILPGFTFNCSPSALFVALKISDDGLLGGIWRSRRWLEWLTRISPVLPALPCFWTICMAPALTQGIFHICLGHRVGKKAQVAPIRPPHSTTYSLFFYKCRLPSPILLHQHRYAAKISS